MQIRYLTRAASMTGFALITALSASAQNQGLVIRDGSLGTGPAGVVGAGTDPTGGAASYLITPDQGKQVGGNLFHSFSQFSIGRGETATFTGPDSVSGPQSVHAIVSRVTGGSVSDIDGRLRSTIPGADVFLLNPAGVMFGPDARLEVKGSFHVSTADSLEFDNGEVFEARAGGSVPLLQVARPGSFGFLDATAGSITVNGAILETPAGAELSIVAGGLDVTGSTLLTPGGRVRLAAVAGPGALPLAPVSPDEALPGLIGGEVRLSDSLLGAGFMGTDPARGVSIEGGRLQVSGSRIQAESGGSGPGFGVLLRASDRIELENRSEVVTDAFDVAGSESVYVEAPEVVLRSSSNIKTGTRGNSSARAIKIRAADRLVVDSGSNISSDVFPDPYGVGFYTGDAGSIDIAARKLVLQGRITSANQDYLGVRYGGVAGAITIRAADSVIVDGGFISGDGPIDIDAGTLRLLGSSISTFNQQLGGAGNAIKIRVADSLIVNNGYIVCDGATGGIDIGAGTLQLLGDDTAVGRFAGSILSFVHGDDAEGAGAITIDVAGSVIVDGGFINTQREIGPGASPSIDITAGTLQVREFGRIKSGGSEGEGGATTILVAGSMIVDGGQIDSSASQLDFSHAGSIYIEAGTLQVRNRGSIISLGASGAAGGPITIRAADSLVVDRFGIISSTVSNIFNTGIGDAGSIDIEAGTVQVLNGGRIESDTQTPGSGGAIKIRAADSLVVDAGFISSTAFSGSGDGSETGDAGSIDIEAGTLQLLNRGGIFSDTFTEGAAGAIKIHASRAVQIEGVGSGILKGEASGIRSTTNANGQGGSIAIVAPLVTMLDGALVTSESSAGGDAGSIDVTAFNDLELVNSSIQSRAPDANGGSIRLHAGRVLTIQGGRIGADVGAGTGGNIALGGSVVFLKDGTRPTEIVARAGEGRGGTISIDSLLFFSDPLTVLDASSGDPTLSGTVEILTPGTDVVGSITALPMNFLDASALVGERCSARAGKGGMGSLVVLRRDGAPAMPDGLLPAATSGATPTGSGSFESEPRLLFSGSPDLFAASCP